MSENATPDWSSEFEHYKKLSREVVTNEDIINFFNQHQKAFYLDSFSSSWANMMEAYELKESLSSEQLNKIEECCGFAFILNAQLGAQKRTIELN